MRRDSVFRQCASFFFQVGMFQVLGLIIGTTVPTIAESFVWAAIAYGLHLAWLVGIKVVKDSS